MVRLAARAQQDLSWFKNWRIRKPLESCFKKPTYFLRQYSDRPAAEMPCSVPFKIPPAQGSAQHKRSPSLRTQAATLRPNRWLVPLSLTIRSREGSKLSGVWPGRSQGSRTPAPTETENTSTRLYHWGGVDCALAALS